MDLRELRVGTRATLTIEETGRLLGISRGSTRQAIQAGEIPALRLGRRVLVPVPALLRMLDSSDAGSAACGDAPGE